MIAAGDEIKFIDHDASAVGSRCVDGLCTGLHRCAYKRHDRLGRKLYVRDTALYRFESSTLFDDENTLYGDANYTKYEVVVCGHAYGRNDFRRAAKPRRKRCSTGSVDPEGNTAVEYHFDMKARV